MYSQEQGGNVQSIAASVAPALHATVFESDSAAVVPSKRQLVKPDVRRSRDNAGLHAPADDSLVLLDCAGSEATCAHKDVLVALRWGTLPAMVVPPAADVMVCGDATCEIPWRRRDLQELDVRRRVQLPLFASDCHMKFSASVIGKHTRTLPFCPQQDTKPSVFNAHVKSFPQLTCVNLPTGGADTRPAVAPWSTKSVINYCQTRVWDGSYPSTGWTDPSALRTSGNRRC